MRLSSAMQLAQAIASTAASAIREQVTTHSAMTSATASEVWDLVSAPDAWPSFDPRVSRVEGEALLLSNEMHLIAVSRIFGRRVSIDVVSAVPGQSLTVTARLFPGLSEVAEHQIVTVASGGTQIVSRVRAAGPLGIVSAVPTWVSAELVVRLLAWRAGRAHSEDSPGASAATAASTT